MARNEPFIVKMSLEDLITPGLTRINKQLAAIQAPTKRLQTQLSKFADATGITKVANALSDLGRKAVSAFLSVAQLIPALGALTGIASIAGIGALVKQFAEWGNELARNAVLLNMTPTNLNRLELAAQQSGAKIGSMTQSLIAMRQNLIETVTKGGDTPLGKQLATIGLNASDLLKQLNEDPTAAVKKYINALTNGADSTHHGFTDVGQRMKEAAIAGFNADTQGFITEPGKVDERLAQADKNAGPNVDEQAKNALKLQEQFANVRQAATGMANDISSAITPIVTRWLVGISDWLDKNENREWISKTAKESLEWLERQFMTLKAYLEKNGLDDFKKDWEGVAHAITATADAMDRVASLLSAGWHIPAALGGLVGHALSLDTEGLQRDWDELNRGQQDVRHFIKPSTNEAAGPAPPESHNARSRSLSEWWHGLFSGMTQPNSENGGIASPTTLDDLHRGAGTPEWLHGIFSGMTQPNSENGGISSPAVLDDLRRRVGTPDENAKKTGEQVSQNLDKTWQDSAADSIKNALRELFAIKSAPGAPAPGAPAPGTSPPSVAGNPDSAAQSPAQQVDRAQQARAAFVAAGYTDQQAVGLVANLVAESGLNTGSRGDEVNGIPTAFGIAQWHQDRIAKIQAGTGIDVKTATYADQLKAIIWELDHNEAAAGKQLRGATTYGSAGAAVSRYYERPARMQEKMIQRGWDAESWHRRLGDRPIVAVPPAANNNTPAGTVDGKIDTKIVIDLAPGLRARSNSTAVGRNLTPPRTDSVMKGSN